MLYLTSFILNEMRTTCSVKEKRDRPVLLAHSAVVCCFGVVSLISGAVCSQKNESQQDETRVFLRLKANAARDV